MKSARRIAEAAVLLLALGGSLGCPGSPAARPDAPNILLLVMDTARADRFTPARTDLTPRFQELARQSVVFPRAHSVAPWTLPAHASMFSGRYPGEHGATWAAYGDVPGARLGEFVQQKLVLAEPERLLAERLRSMGYDTVGITTNPWIGPRTGLDHGFREFVVASRGEWRRPERLTRLAADAGLEPSQVRGPAGTALAILESRFRSGAIREPWFVFLNWIDPHFPYDAPEPLRSGGDPQVLERIRRGPRGELELRMLAGGGPFEGPELAPLYDAEIATVDDHLGTLIERLEERGQWEDTLILVTSDHGEHLGEDGRFSHQLSLEDELLRVPLLVKPAGTAVGRVDDDALVSNLDVYATALAAAVGRPLRSEEAGRSVDLLVSAEKRRPWLLSELYFSNGYLRILEETHPGFDPAPHRVVRRRVGTADGRFLFEGGEASSSSAAPPEELSRWVRDFDRQSGAATRSDAEPDEELRRSLEALGYVGAGDE